jgi:hypothetical protein
MYLRIQKREAQMSTWTNDELKRIGDAEELQIATLRQNDTLRKQVIIWVVRLNDDLYVRCVNGREGSWFRGVLTRYAGRIWAGGVEKDVSFVEESDADLNAQIDICLLSQPFLQQAQPGFSFDPVAAVSLKPEHSSCQT